MTYQHGLAETLAAVDDGRAEAAVLIRPVSVAEIERTAREGLLMPPKSTFFTPKLKTGLVLAAARDCPSTFDARDRCCRLPQGAPPRGIEPRRRRRAGPAGPDRADRDELAHLAPQLDVILESVAHVSDVAADDIPPTSHALPLTNVFRPDVVAPSLPGETVLARRPAAEAGPVPGAADPRGGGVSPSTGSGAN